MLKKIVLVFAALAVAKAQIPSLGWCPDYVPMTNFEMERFLGVWYEAERYFQISELVSRCLTSNYTITPDGKMRVYNEVTNRFTGVKRIVEGEIKPPASKSEVGKLNVKYSTPLTPETQYSVLESDYNNYAVLWSCSAFGPIISQSAWLMTRSRNPSGEILQQAYGVLDKFKILKRYFVKSDQSECSYEAPVTLAPVTVPPPAPAAAAAVPQPSVPAVAPAPASAPVKEEPAAKKSVEGVYLRSTAVLRDADPVDESRKENIEVEGVEDRLESSFVAEESPAVLLPEAKPPQEIVSKPIAPETIPQVILKVAESVKEAAATIEDPIVVAEESKTVETFVAAESKPEIIVAAAAAAAVEPSKIVEELRPESVETAAEEQKSERKPAEEILAEEKPIFNAGEEKPAEETLATVADAIESEEKVKENAKPVEEIPEAPKSAEPVAAVLKSEIIEIPAIPAEETAKKIPADSEGIVKSVETPDPIEEPVISETAKVSEPLKSFEGAPLPETILEDILESVVPETGENGAAVPLKTIPYVPEESKAEAEAEKNEATLPESKA